jgi:uncharacterized protein (TIGR02246 family)
MKAPDDPNDLKEETMEAVAHKVSPEDEVRDLLDSYFDAVRANDVDRITAHYAPDVVAYDAIAQLQFSGLESYKAHWKACLEMCQHMVFEPRELTIAASGDVAYGHCLIRCGGPGPDGNEQSGWTRATLAARKRNGRWLIVHEHYSVPFDPESGKILGDAAPGNAKQASAA